MGYLMLPLPLKSSERFTIHPMDIEQEIESLFCNILFSEQHPPENA
jgi:hypothetical protein